jgi:hypothetical protein
VVALLHPDLGKTTEAAAENELVITFTVSAPPGVYANTATAYGTQSATTVTATSGGVIPPVPIIGPLGAPHAAGVARVGHSMRGLHRPRV